MMCALRACFLCLGVTWRLLVLGLLAATLAVLTTHSALSHGRQWLATGQQIRSTFGVRGLEPRPNKEYTLEAPAAYPEHHSAPQAAADPSHA